MAFNYDEYLEQDKMPTLWCWGCGDGVIPKSVIRAIENLDGTWMMFVLYQELDVLEDSLLTSTVIQFTQHTVEL